MFLVIFLLIIIYIIWDWKTNENFSNVRSSYILQAMSACGNGSPIYGSLNCQYYLDQFGRLSPNIIIWEITGTNKIELKLNGTDKCLGLNEELELIIVPYENRISFTKEKSHIGTILKYQDMYVSKLMMTNKLGLMNTNDSAIIWLINKLEE